MNPYSEASLKGDSYEEFDFEQGLDDVSENGRDLTEGKNAEVERRSPHIERWRVLC